MGIEFNTKIIYMEPTIQLLANINKDNPEFIKTLVESGQVKEMKDGQKYLVVNA
jgi:hypothetical protein|tara:strand:+ start:464 stop:625 length:162 start_codon:yes stop_codon:yes gene_type:complete